MAHTDKEIIDAFRTATKFKSAGQIARESDITLTTAKRLKGKGYPKGALKGEVREAVVAYTQSISDQTVPRGTPQAAPSDEKKAAAYDLIVKAIALISDDASASPDRSPPDRAKRAAQASILKSLLDQLE